MKGYYEDNFYEDILFPIKQDERAIIARHYQLFLETEDELLDDLTWNDLDLDELYVQMNNTQSGVGDHLLYAMLRQPCLNEAELQKRTKIITWAHKEVAERSEVVSTLSSASKRYRDDVEQPFLETGTTHQQTYIVYVIWLGIIASMIAMLFTRAAIFPLMLFFVVSSFYYFYLHKKLEHHLDPLVYLIEQIEVLHRLSRCSMEHLPELKQEIDELSSALAKIRKKSALGYFSDTAGWMNSITHQESRLYDSYASFVYENKALVLKGLRLVGMLDACIAVAAYQGRTKASHDIVWLANVDLQAQQMIHPLVEHCVANDVDLSKNQMLTGSNATGKSTYLKMIALNAVLAQSFGIVFAKQYRACFYRIATSMSIHDHIEKGESTFVAEGKALKHLLDLDNEQIPSLCVIDEILRGTNTLDRISASAVILKEFIHHNSRCLIATHDIELTQLLNTEYACAHFSETMKNGKMSFDYRLHPGVTTTRNAIDLLRVFAYEEDIVKDARRRLKQFEATGVWEVLA